MRVAVNCATQVRHSRFAQLSAASKHESGFRADHPLRLVREVADTALKSLTGELAKLYSPIGRESIPLERLMRALLLQAFQFRS
jgi:hypothetical protein